ncbi:MAG: hypothetical protein Q7S65_04840 [Nanoarchaeota archaeon]|nr:hypothetical protein [Nanoarchaeota archaeon]
MVTIAHLAEKTIREKPFLQEALYRRLINYQALAQDLAPGIEKELGKPVKPATVMAAIRRYADKLEKSATSTAVFGKDCAIELKSKIVEISLRRSKTLFQLVPKLFESVDFEDGGILNFTTGNQDISIITNAKYADLFLYLLKGENVLEVNTDLIALSVKYPKTFRRVPGTLHQMIRVLAWEHINILELIETMTETIFILSEDDAMKAFKALQRLIQEK